MCSEREHLAEAGQLKEQPHKSCLLAKEVFFQVMDSTTSNPNKILSETCLLITFVKVLKWKRVGRQKRGGYPHVLASKKNSPESHLA